MFRLACGQLLVVALAAFPCVGAQSSGFLKPEVGSNPRDISPVVSVLQESQKESKPNTFSKEQEKLANLKKQVKQQEELVAEQEKLANLKKQVKQQEELVAKEERNAADSVGDVKAATRTAVQAAAGTAGKAVNDVMPKPSLSSLAKQEAAAGKRALEEMEKRHKEEQKQREFSMKSYEKIMTRMSRRAGPAGEERLKKQIATQRRQQRELLESRQEKQMQFMKLRIKCMGTVPGDQSSWFLSGQATATNFKVCKTTQEKEKVKRDNKDLGKVAKCMQPDVERALQPQYHGLTQNQKAAAKKQTERFEQMRQQMVKKQHQANDKIIEQSFACADRACAAQPANAAESKQAQLRRFNYYQGCVSMAVMGQFASAMTDTFEGLFKNEKYEQKAMEETVKDEEKEAQQFVDEQKTEKEEDRLFPHGMKVVDVKEKEAKKHTATVSHAEDAVAETKKAVLEATDSVAKKGKEAAAQDAEAKNAKKAVQDVLAKKEKDFKAQDSLVRQAEKAVIAARKVVGKKQESKDQRVEADKKNKGAQKEKKDGSWSAGSWLPKMPWQSLAAVATKTKPNIFMKEQEKLANLKKQVKQQEVVAEQEKLANLKKQVKQQEELVAKVERNAADSVGDVKAATRTAVQGATGTAGKAVNDVMLKKEKKDDSWSAGKWLPKMPWQSLAVVATKTK